MKCKLCKEREADKKNTHFLTDSIIRTCLNEDGTNIREKGFYFDMSNDKSFVDFNFQRNTSFEKLTNTFGRPPTESEIERAKEIPFSIDYVFCSQCEKRFTEIENKFIDKYLKRFRNNEFRSQTSLNLEDYREIKSFFLLQVWRTSVADPEMLSIPKDIYEDLREIILKNSTVEIGRLEKYPLTVTYLTTIDGKNGQSGNYVGYTDDRNPNLIFMNDFVIQFFPTCGDFRYFNFYNLNDPHTYKNYKNTESSEFTFKILADDERRKLLKEFILHDKVKALKDFYAISFKRIWFALFGFYPTNSLTYQYLKYIVNDSESSFLHYTSENISKLTENFIREKM